MCKQSKTIDRVEALLRQLGGERAVEELSGEVLLRIEELPCDKKCAKVGHLDVVYSLAVDTLVEHWQDKRKERMEAWDLVPTGCELNNWLNS